MKWCLSQHGPRCGSTASGFESGPFLGAEWLPLWLAVTDGSAVQ